MLKPLSRDTLTKQATDTLRRFILIEDLPAGAQLPSERELSDILSVSRNIVREALSVLVAEGLIVKKAGRGIFVTDFDRSVVAPQVAVTVDYDGRNLKELAEARAAVELGAVDLMARRIRDEQIQQLEAINQSMANNMRKNRSTVREDIEFHNVLLQSTHNAVLTELLPLFIEYFRIMVLHRPDSILRNPERVVVEHQQIIDALRSRDPVAVRQALVDHLHLPNFTSE